MSTRFVQRRLTILNVAYPLARVGPDAVGGAEQVLTQIDAALDDAGHQSIVIACPHCDNLLPEISNGTNCTRQRHAKRRFAIALGRICPEKGFHMALDAAAQAEMPLLVGGEVFPYPAHEKYFHAEIMPRLGH